MHIELEQFSGPYDLLLRLIEDKELSITAISLANVTDQYLSNMDLLYESDLDPEELLGFIAVASKLLYLKSKELLPVIEIDDDDESSLEEHLKLYKIFQEASLLIKKQIDKNRSSYGSLPVKIEKRIKFTPPVGLTVDSVFIYCRQVIDALRPLVKLPKVLLENVVTLKERVDHFYSLLGKHRELNFNKFLTSSSSKLDLIISFLAMLELINQRMVSVEQGEHFDDIIVKAL